MLIILQGVCSAAKPTRSKHLAHCAPTWAPWNVACATHLLCSIAGSFHAVSAAAIALDCTGMVKCRLSISWPRILPGGGRATDPNPAGLWFYKNLLQELHAAGITPVVTLYHSDLPQVLQVRPGCSFTACKVL